MIVFFVQFCFMHYWFCFWAGTDIATDVAKFIFRLHVVAQLRSSFARGTAHHQLHQCSTCTGVAVPVQQVENMFWSALLFLSSVLSPSRLLADSPLCAMFYCSCMFLVFSLLRLVVLQYSLSCCAEYTHTHRWTMQHVFDCGCSWFFI